MEYARQALGNAKAAGIEPPPERQHKPSPRVEALRGQLTADTPPTAPLGSAEAEEVAL